MTPPLSYQNIFLFLFFPVLYRQTEAVKPEQASPQVPRHASSAAEETGGEGKLDNEGPPRLIFTCGEAVRS